MKKFVAILLVVVLALSLCACAAKPAAPATSAAPSGAPQKETAKWPSGDVTILAGYSVGSLTDVNIHTIADWITEKTGKTVKVENNDVGGGANLATKLVKAKPDGQTIMLIGMNCISNFYNGTWSVNPADFSKFKVVCGAIQPLPDSGCMILTQAGQPYSNWKELAEYAKANPGKVTVASIAGKVMDSKMKALFNGTGVDKDIRWVSTTNADASAGLLGGTINIVMLDETTATGYLKDGKLKALLNCRVSKDFSVYKDGPEKDIIAKVPTLSDVFGDKAVDYMIPNRSVFVAPAGTPDDVCAQIASVIDAIDKETSGTWYDRCRVNGGTSKYYTWPAKDVMDEWTRLDPVIKNIVEMAKKK